MEHRRSAVAEGHAGMTGIEKAVSPEALQERLAIADAGGQHGVGR